MAAGAAAVVLSHNPGLTAAQVKTVLENGADKLGGATGRTELFGFGRVNLLAALNLVVAPVPIT
jgi:hypothetical protein